MDLQKKTLGASKCDEEAHAAWRKQVAHLDSEQLVFVGECGSNVGLAPLHARAPKGERAFGKAPRNRGKNTTLLRAWARAVWGLLLWPSRAVPRGPCSRPTSNYWSWQRRCSLGSRRS